uniref:Uncharacterized protein n=1 Tax=Petromyzon marinus TaxID=7757 RepID=S4RCX0_PETMA
MNSAEQTVTWLITLGVLHSPKKRVSDPGAFLQRSLRDGLVLCRLLDRLLPGSLETAKVFQEPKAEAECVSNIREFLKGVSHLRLELFEPHDLYKGQNFDCVLNTLVALNKATADLGLRSEAKCLNETKCNCHCINTPGSSGGQLPPRDSSRPPQRQSKSLEMTESGGGMVVRAKFTFQRTNEDELSFEKGDVITVTRVEHGGWWEGAFNGHTGWFPSNYVRELKASDRPTSPKAVGSKGGAKPPESPPAAKGYYDVVVKNIVETEQEYSKELHCLLATFLRPLQASDKLPPADMALLLGNLEVIASFQQSLVHSLEECAKLPEAQQHVGSCFMSLRSQMETLYLEYCANHPWAVKVLQDNREMLGEFMESKGANSPGILMLTTSLSKPFMRLDKYPTLLKELERHIEVLSPKRPYLPNPLPNRSQKDPSQR